MSEVLIFPLRNEVGFRVDSVSAYQHVIMTIIDAQLELAQDYPDHPVLVVFKVEDGS